MVGWLASKRRDPALLGRRLGAGFMPYSSTPQRPIHLRNATIQWWGAVSAAPRPAALYCPGSALHLDHLHLCHAGGGPFLQCSVGPCSNAWPGGAGSCSGMVGPHCAACIMTVSGWRLATLPPLPSATLHCPLRHPATLATLYCHPVLPPCIATLATLRSSASARPALNCKCNLYLLCIPEPTEQCSSGCNGLSACIPLCASQLDCQAAQGRDCRSLSTPGTERP
jgi:hypothetical protein